MVEPLPAPVWRAKMTEPCVAPSMRTSRASPLTPRTNRCGRWTLPCRFRADVGRFQGRAAAAAGVVRANRGAAATAADDAFDASAVAEPATSPYTPRPSCAPVWTAARYHRLRVVASDIDVAELPGAEGNAQHGIGDDLAGGCTARQQVGYRGGRRGDGGRYTSGDRLCHRRAGGLMLMAPAAAGA